MRHVLYLEISEVMDADMAENASVSVEQNASNLTGRDAATVEGIVLTYSSLFLMALGPIFIGALRSVVYHSDLKSRGEEATDRIDMKDAAVFPLYASAGLFGLYLFFKESVESEGMLLKPLSTNNLVYIPKEYVNLLLSAIFIVLGVSALARAISVIVDPYLPAFITERLTEYRIQLTVKPPKQEKEESSLCFHTLDLVVAALSALLGIIYFFSKHWILNNLFGLAFSLNAIEMISLDRVAVGCMLLGGLFIYDIFWVFGTEVMVFVAKSFEGPIKLMFPMDLLEKGLSANNFGMLGLGDIVVPGLYIALLCRFDFCHRKGKPRIYFYAGFMAYILGLLTTIGVMHFFRAAQPALLYLVPSCLGIPFLAAVINGDLSALISYRDYPNVDNKKKEDKTE